MKNNYALLPHTLQHLFLFKTTTDKSKYEMLQVETTINSRIANVFTVYI